MKIDSTELARVAQAHGAPRMDLYAGIHKAMRALMADTLLAVGRMDTDDVAEVTEVAGRVTRLLDFCADHLRHENDFVHAAMEARAPGASDAVAHEHDEHAQAITQLRGLAEGLPAQPAAQRAARSLDLYRHLSLFVAHNFEHMLVEETTHNAVLWSRYTDAELMDIHHALVASIPPNEMMFVMQWMIPFMSPTERSAVLGDMQCHAPAPAFEAVMGLVRTRLSEGDWGKLTRSLGLPAAPGLACA